MYCPLACAASSREPVSIALVIGKADHFIALIVMSKHDALLA